MTDEVPRMTVPEVRDELLTIAARLRLLPDPDREPESPNEPAAIADRIEYLVGQLVRRFHGRSPRRSSVPMTAEIAEEIREFHQRFPLRTEFELAVRFGVNQARVSEALYGFRDGGWR